MKEMARSLGERIAGTVRDGGNVEVDLKVLEAAGVPKDSEAYSDWLEAYGLRQMPRMYGPGRQYVRICKALT